MPSFIEVRGSLVVDPSPRDEISSHKDDPPLPLFGLILSPTPTFFRVFGMPVNIVRVCPIQNLRQPKLAILLVPGGGLIHRTGRFISLRFYVLCICASHNFSFRLLFFNTEKSDFRFHGFPDRLNKCCSFNMFAIMSILIPDCLRFFITVRV